ncbi:MAG: ribonuclease HII [Deltaproteobacteria bacterium]|nr:ribonuclease HII [Deltaproteobacteria bacterium]
MFPGEARSIDGPFAFESAARKAGYAAVAGVDEVGRGPLAGPVVAAAVILPERSDLDGVQDSKKMTENARVRAFSVIHEKAFAVGIGVVPPAYIDEHNILDASLEAMKQAVSFLEPRPDFLLVDGIFPVPMRIQQRCLKHGDKRSLSISAASVIAKVYRDRIMCSLDARFPQYGFSSHKGYGTEAHLKALRRHGPCPIHRRSFRGVRVPTDGWLF